MRAVVLAIALPQAASACTGSGDLRITFFANLPPALSDQPVIAKAKLRERIQRRGLSTATVRKTDVTFAPSLYQVKVIEPIQGVTAGEFLKVGIVFHSCRGHPSRLQVVGGEWFIAGVLRDGVFWGARRSRDLAIH